MVSLHRNQRHYFLLNINRRASLGCLGWRGGCEVAVAPLLTTPAYSLDRAIQSSGVEQLPASLLILFTPSQEWSNPVFPRVSSCIYHFPSLFRAVTPFFGRHKQDALGQCLHGTGCEQICKEPRVTTGWGWILESQLWVQVAPLDVQVTRVSYLTSGEPLFPHL